jgi:Skp family chaperone for outer membrane proteins
VRTERLLIVVLALGVLALALRPFQPDASASRGALAASNLAVCAVPTIVNELMASDRFLEAREALREEYEERTRDLRERRSEIEQQFEGMEQGDPAAPALGREYQELSREIFRADSEFQREQSEMQASQLAECYDLARASAIGVGEDLGYDFVIASGSPDEELNRADTQALLGQLSRRPVLLYPDEDDITDDVRDDLNL